MDIRIDDFREAESARRLEKLTKGLRDSLDKISSYTGTSRSMDKVVSPRLNSRLVEANTGPVAVNSKSIEGVVRVENATVRSGASLSVTLAKQMNNHGANPALHEFGMDATQMGRVSFPQGMMGHSRGSPGRSREDLTTLVFGLIELAHAPDCQRLTVATLTLRLVIPHGAGGHFGSG